MDNLDLVYQEASNSQSPTHSRPAECGSRQAIQTRPDDSNGMVSPSIGFQSYMQQVAPASNRPVCHEVQQQVTSICVTGSGSPSYSSGCTQPAMGGSVCVCLSTSSHLGQSGEVAGHPMQENHCDGLGVVQHALVLGPASHVQSNPIKPARCAQPIDTALQSDPSQKSDKSESPCMAPRAPRASASGFSKAVAERIEAPQRGSTRSVYEATWSVFTKWCLTHQVDFRAPPVKSVADFLMYLFQDRKLQPSTIDGYRSAIADKLGNSSVNISKDENLMHLLDSFHRDRPKGRKGIPSWNLSLVLHQLTKAPFGPIKEASLKHLTFKTVFLLAQSDWSKGVPVPITQLSFQESAVQRGSRQCGPSGYTSPGPNSDRSLFPVRALRYYFDRTSDLRQNKELVFVSFKKGFDKDISPATISWIKQTVILCYELSDQEAHTLHQVIAHDVRAFAASKACQSATLMCFLREVYFYFLWD